MYVVGFHIKVLSLLYIPISFKEQTINGSEDEIAAANEIMDKMREYFITEVLARPEYAPVRGSW